MPLSIFLSLNLFLYLDLNWKSVPDFFFHVNPILSPCPGNTGKQYKKGLLVKCSVWFYSYPRLPVNRDDDPM